MKNLILLFTLFTIPFLINAQETTFKKRKVKGLTAVKVNASALKNNFNASIQQITAPPPSGNSYRDKLAIQKKKGAELFPRKIRQDIQSRSMVDQPTIETSIKGNTSTGGRPLDNHFAVNNEGQLVTMVNSNLTVKGPTGIVLVNLQLSDFASALGSATQMFDPKVIFDPISDRYIMTWLGGFDSANSIIVVAFSETNDATGDWNVYGLPGSPENDGTWSDYPMITYTDKEFFLTLNSIRDTESWQAGFDRTIIYQINKAEGYAGQELVTTLWQEIVFDGGRLRNVCPIKPATEVASDEVYFLSNRNFDLQNDTIFLMHLSGTQDVATLSVSMIQSDLSYGVPPDGEQEEGVLATNDSRILDGYLLDDRIEFVGNSRNLDNGRAGIYHGTVYDVSTNPTITATNISNDVEDYGYPSIAYTGVEPGEVDGIIMFSHTGIDRYSGHSAVYFETPGEYSDVLTLKEGFNYIDMINNSEVERWGDYSANQRDYANPGMVWIASSYGVSTNQNAAWLTQLARPNMSVSTQSAKNNNIEVLAYPNPTVNDVKVVFEIFDVKNLKLQIVDVNGSLVKLIHDDRPKRQGTLEFTMSTAPLGTGIYFLQIIADGQSVATEKIVVK